MPLPLEGPPPSLPVGGGVGPAELDHPSEAGPFALPCPAMRRIRNLLAAATLAVAALTPALLSSSPAHASSWDSPTFQDCESGFKVNWSHHAAQGGFLGWAAGTTAEVDHSGNYDCSYLGGYSSATGVHGFLVERWSYPAGWSTCYYGTVTYNGSVQLPSINSTQGVQNSLCTSTTWPDGYTRFSYTWTINSVNDPAGYVVTI